MPAPLVGVLTLRLAGWATMSPVSMPIAAAMTAGARWRMSASSPSGFTVTTAGGAGGAVQPGRRERRAGEHADAADGLDGHLRVLVVLGAIHDPAWAASGLGNRIFGNHGERQSGRPRG